MTDSTNDNYPTSFHEITLRINENATITQLFNKSGKGILIGTVDTTKVDVGIYEIRLEGILSPEVNYSKVALIATSNNTETGKSVSQNVSAYLLENQTALRVHITDVASKEAVDGAFTLLFRW